LIEKEIKKKLSPTKRWSEAGYLCVRQNMKKLRISYVSSIPLGGVTIYMYSYALMRRAHAESQYRGALNQPLDYTFFDAHSGFDTITYVFFWPMLTLDELVTDRPFLRSPKRPPPDAPRSHDGVFTTSNNEPNR
jgi:hypothetical protein